ncbi:Protein of unknown function [Gryllus bimaculatus]|nr:Protein of unknown function [Gryllus bimaculatus]
MRLMERKTERQRGILKKNKKKKKKKKKKMMVHLLCHHPCLHLRLLGLMSFLLQVMAVSALMILTVTPYLKRLNQKLVTLTTGDDMLPQRIRSPQDLGRVGREMGWIMVRRLKLKKIPLKPTRR